MGRSIIGGIYCTPVYILESSYCEVSPSLSPYLLNQSLPGTSPQLKTYNFWKRDTPFRIANDLLLSQLSDGSYGFLRAWFRNAGLIEPLLFTRTEQESNEFMIKSTISLEVNIKWYYDVALFGGTAFCEGID